MADLDDQIRDLVARAVADAPEAPSLDETTRPAGREVRPGVRWIAGGVAGLSIAAALVALFWIGGDRVADEAVTPLAPSTPPTAVEPVSPTAATVPGTAVEVPVSTVPPPTTSVVVTSTVPSPQGETSAFGLVQAGPNGVVPMASGDAEVEWGEPVTTDAMATAFRIADGRVFMQRSDDQRDPEADTSIQVWMPDAPTEILVQPMPTPELAEAPKRLHDVAVVDGDVVLLIETGPVRCNGFPDCDGSLWALDADSGDVDLLLTQSMWESAFGRLHLSETGLIVGEVFSEALSMPFSTVVPGSAASPIDVAQLGLETEYVDCGICPTAFAVDRSGATIAWLESEPGQFVVVLATLDGSAIDRFPLVDVRSEAPGDGLVPNPWLQLLDVAAGPGPSAGRLIVNPQPVPGAAPVAPAWVDLDTRSIEDGGFEPDSVVTAG